MTADETNPWQIRHSDLKYENAWIAVTHHDVLRPDGKPGIYGVVHFKSLALGVIVLDDEMNTWLVGQYRFPLERYSWEIPEGGGDPAIERLLSIKRELKEEAGIEAATWRHLVHFDLSNSTTDEVGTIWLATDLSFGEAKPDGDEVIVQRKVPFEEAYAMTLDGRITDAISIMAIQRVRLMQLEGTL